MLGELFEKLDGLLCLYLGLEKEEIQPNRVQIIDKKLSFTSVTPFKRYAIKESWDNFHEFSIKNTTTENCEKLGLAIGKAIAKNLVVSFEKVEIKRDHQ